jgi:hypothetical protein
MRRRKRDDSSPISLFSFQDLITSLSGILILMVLMMAIQPIAQVVSDAALASRTDHTDAINRLRESVDGIRQKVEALRRSLEGAATEDRVEMAVRAVEAEQEHAALVEKIASTERECSLLEQNIDAARVKKEAYDRETTPLRRQLEELRAALAASDNAIFFIPEEGSTKTPMLVECSGTAVRVGFIGRDEQPSVFTPDADGVKRFAAHSAKFSTSREYFVFMIKPSGAVLWVLFMAEAERLGFDIGYDALEEDCVIGFVKGY